MPDIGFKVIPKKFFFDRKAVTDAVSKGAKVALSKIGAFVRTRARSSMRRTKKSAPAGQPPRAHAGNLKDLIFFAYDDHAGSVMVGGTVVVGPVKFKDGDAPELLEFGGTATRTRRNGKKYEAHYQGNPFMGPSLEAEIQAGTVASAWAGCVRK